MAEHTPDSWCYDAKSRSVLSANGKIVAPHPHRDQGGAAVDTAGYLIAAAPDLLAACEKVMSEVYFPENWEDDVKAAIAKARGEADDGTQA